MTIVDAVIADLTCIQPDTQPAHFELAPSWTGPLEAAVDDVSCLLPDQEWCDLCSRDEAGEPGMAQDVLEYTIEELMLPLEQWDPAWGAVPEYAVTRMACGHTFARLC